MKYEEAYKHCIFRYVSGSQAYGTNRPDSDEDFRGVFIAPMHCAFDLFKTKEIGAGTIGGHLRNAIEDLNEVMDDSKPGFFQRLRHLFNPDSVKILDKSHVEAAIQKINLGLEVGHGDLSLAVETVQKPGVDEELQELRKFLKLASNSNPNIIEFLYVDRLITHETDAWRKIRAKRHLILSKKARHTFAGYAQAQLTRISNHRGYLLSPPSHKPDREEFGLEKFTKIAKENEAAILSLPEKWLKADARDYVLREKKYKAAMDHWNSYQKWDRERNPARKEMERKYGFDVKHAMHLIRLLRMGQEILKDGEVNVYRADRDELRGVLRGEWTYDHLVSYASSVNAGMNILYEKSTLRHEPDHAAISDLYKEICEEHYGVKINVGTLV